MRYFKKQRRVLAFALVLMFTIAASLAILPVNPTASTSANTAASKGAYVTADYGDPLQYEWPQWYGNESYTFWYPGPAPDSPDLLWRTYVRGASSGRYYPAAFNGKVFLYSGQRITAVDGITGAIAWNYTYTVNGPVSGTPPSGVARISTGMPYKLDDTHAIAGRVCFNPNDGSMWWYSTWKIDDQGVNTTFATSGGWGGGGCYMATEKIFVTDGRAWNFSDVSKQPTIAWNANNKFYGGASFDCVGEGVVVCKSTNFVRGLDAKTGESIWVSPLGGGTDSYKGLIYEGLYVRGCLDDSIWAIDVHTGELVWKWAERVPFSNWGTGGGAAYGMIYWPSGSGKLHAFEAKTGRIVWVHDSGGWCSYQGTPLIADGKVYWERDNGPDPYTGEIPGTRWHCVDAFTGKVLWILKGVHTTGGGGREGGAGAGGAYIGGGGAGSHLIAYGNIYMITGMDSSYLRCYGNAKSDWPMFRHDPQLSGVASYGPENLVLRWKYKTGGGVVSSPAIVNDKVYVGSLDSYIYCLNAWTGAEIWKFQIGNMVSSSPAVVGGKLYTGADDGNVYCLDAETGDQIWKKPVGAFLPSNMSERYLPNSSPIVVGNRIYVGSADARLYCLNTADGNILWSFDTAPGPKMAQSTNLASTPHVDGNYVWVVNNLFPTSRGAVLYKLDASNGTPILTIPYPTSGKIYGSPVIGSGVVLVPEAYQNWYAFNATTGALLWKYVQALGTNQIGSAAYYMNRFVFVDHFFMACVYAINGTGGMINGTAQPYLWRTFLKREIFNSPTVAGSGIDIDLERQNLRVYASNNDDFVYVIDGETGARESWYFTESFIISSVSLYKSKAYVGCRDWYVYCLEDYNPVPPLKISIKIATDKTQVNKTKSESVTVSGSIFPVLPIPYENSPTPTSMKITFIKPDSSTVDIPVTVNAQGTFTGTYQPDKAGQWGVVAYVSGDPTANYAESYSNSIDLKVVEQTTPSQPTQPEEAAGTPMEIIYAAVGIVAVVIIVAVAYMWMKSKKK